MTIVEKVLSILQDNTEVSLKDLYDKLPEHTPASIRGNINRYIAKNPNAEIKRVGKGTYSYIEIVKVETRDDGKKNVSYSVNYFKKDKELHFFYKDFITDDISINDGLYFDTQSYDNLSNLIHHHQNLQAIFAKGDVRDILPKLKSESFDLLITDPPYRTISGGKGGKGSPRGMLSKNDGKIFNYNDIDIDEWISDVYRVMKEGSQGYIFTNFLNLQHYMETVQKAGFKIHNLLIWEKNTATPNRWYMKNCEYVLFIRKGKARSIKNAGCKTVHQFNNIVGDKIHETEKPINLLRQYIQNSSTGDWVLDPFAGSGSTMIAALLENIKCFSIEIDDKYIKPVIERINGYFKTGTDILCH